MIGLYFMVGFLGTIKFFILKKYQNWNMFIYYFALGKIKGTCFYFVGFVVILVFKFTLIGFLLQLYGLFSLFKSFFPLLFESLCSIPIIGPYFS